MRFQFLAVLILTVVVGVAYWYNSTAHICPAPLSYRLGQLDDHFNITADEAIAHLAEAELYWEEEIGRDLFVYDDNASFVVDFVFDERQEFADAESSESAALDVQRENNEEVLNTVKRLQSEYETLKSTYETEVAEYEARLKEYNQTVSRYNDRGGAPADEYQTLQREQRELDEEASELTVTAGELNQLADRINELGQRGNRMVQDYNQQVASYNQKYGFSREFTQGDYQGDKINIYKFSSERELLGVLTHEFGHALGINHVEGEDSVMYYLLADTTEPVQLSIEDRQALMEVCGTGDEILPTVRRYIREFIKLFK